MTLRRLEGFDWFPTGQDTAKRLFLWAANGWYAYGQCISTPLDVTPGVFGFGNALHFSGAVGNFTPLNNGYVVPTNTNGTEGFIQFHYKRFEDSQPGQPGMIGFFDAVNGQMQFCVTFEEYGIVKVWRGFRPNGISPSTTDFICASTMGSFQDGEVFHVGIYGKVDGTSGAVEVRINTKTVISVVAANTKGSATTTNCDSLWIGGCMTPIGGVSVACHFLLDNLSFNDPAGTVNNSFLGNCRVMTQFVTGNSTPQNFAIGGTAPAATAWQSVLNNLLDDTKYIHDGTVGDYSLFTLQAIVNAPMVFGIQVSSFARQDDATQRTLRNVIKSGATITQGADQLINQTFTRYSDIVELNAATGVGFTGAELNALGQGPKVQA